MLNAFCVGLNDGTEGESAEKPHHYFKEQGWGCEWQGFSEEDVLDTEYHGVRRGEQPWISSPPHSALIPAAF